MRFEIIAPQNWQRSSVSKYCHVQLGKMLQSEPSGDDDELLPYLRAISISKNGVDTSHQFLMWIKPHEKDKFRLRHSDVLVSEGGDAGRAAYFNLDEEYYIQNAINRVRPLDHNTVDSRYLFYWFTFLKLSGYVELVCNVATIAHFTAEKVKASPFAFPPLDTQRRIAAFLDEKTAQIDALISKKKTLLERLTEKRQAIITQAITKGINPAANNWSSKRLKFCATYNDEVLAEDTAEFFHIEYVEISDVSLTGGIINSTKMEFHEAPSRARRKVRSGDILISTVRTYLKAIAAIKSASDNLIASTGFCVIRPGDNLDSSFAGWAVKSEKFVGEVVSRSVGVSYPAINSSQLVDIDIPLPPIASQKHIAAFLDEKTGQIDHASSVINASMNQLSEYRSALITSVVTGKKEI